MKTNAAKNKKSNSKLLARVHRLGISSKVARMIILLLVFMNLGMIFVVASHADAYTTRTILFCSSDQCSGDLNALNNSAVSAQVWYGKNTGRTFSRLTAEIVRGDQPASYYGAGSYSTSETYWRIHSELSRKGLINGTTKAIVQLGFRSMSNCGVAEGVGGRMALADPFKGCSNIQDSVIAHEIGHTLFGTNHVSDGTLMHAPLACNGNNLSNCRIQSGQAPMVNNSPWMNLNPDKSPINPNPAPAPAPSPAPASF